MAINEFGQFSGIHLRLWYIVCGFCGLIDDLAMILTAGYYQPLVLFRVTSWWTKRSIGID